MVPNTQQAADYTAAKPAAKRRIVDADAHIDPPYEMWQDYLPSHLRDKAPHVEEGDEHDWVVFEDHRRPLMMLNNLAGRDTTQFKMKGKLSEARQVWLPEQRLTDMDRDGIDVQILFGGGPLGTSDLDLYIASFSAYNRWLWDFCEADRRRLVPVAYLPMRDVDETLDILREAADLGFRTVNIPAFPQANDALSSSANVKQVRSGQGTALTGDPGNQRSYIDPEFDPLWKEIVDRDMTVTIHLGGRIPRFGDKRHFLPDMLMSKLAMAEPIAIMIFGGLFQRYPTLRLVSVESGVGWFAFAAEYMDRTWEKQRHMVESPLKEKPSFFMDQNVYGSFLNDRFGILNRDMPGGKNIMWSSDYPHSETSFLRSQEVIERDFEGVPEEDINEIVYERARRIYFVD